MKKTYIHALNDGSALHACQKAIGAFADSFLVPGDRLVDLRHGLADPCWAEETSWEAGDVALQAEFDVFVGAHEVEILFDVVREGS